jgi:hypothetical protein
MNRPLNPVNGDEMTKKKEEREREKYKRGRGVSKLSLFEMKRS